MYRTQSGQHRLALDEDHTTNSVNMLKEMASTVFFLIFLVTLGKMKIKELGEYECC